MLRSKPLVGPDILDAQRTTAIVVNTKNRASFIQLVFRFVRVVLLNKRPLYGSLYFITNISFVTNGLLECVKVLSVSLRCPLLAVSGHPLISLIK